MMIHLLLVEDRADCQLIVTEALRGLEISITVATTLAEARKHLEKTKFNLALLDLNLPDGNGIDLMSLLQNGPHGSIPTVLLTGKEDLSDKVLAFTLGAEDYLVKPVNPIELRVRIESKLKKAAAWQQKAGLIQVGALFLDISLMKAVRRDGTTEKNLDLTAKEFKILAFLAKNESKVYSRTEIVNAVWGSATHVLDRTVDSHIYGLRQKMESLKHHIECIPSAGYRFVSQPSEESSSPEEP